jgi:hypothetical protein
MQCAACGRGYDAPANFCPSCGAAIGPAPQAPVEPVNPWAPNPPPYGTPPSAPAPPYGAVSQYGAAPPYGTPSSRYGAPSPYGTPASGYGAAAGYVLPPTEVVRARHRRRQAILIGAVAVVAAAVVVAVAVGATSNNGSSGGTGGVAQTVSEDDGSVLVTYPAAHFTDRFPATPTETQEPASFGSVHVTVYLAVVAAPQRALVASEDIKGHVPEGQLAIEVRAAVASFAASSGLTLSEQHVTTFRGYQANQGSLTDPQGNAYTVLAFMYRDDRMYMIFAPAGDGFDSLTTNFVATK